MTPRLLLITALLSTGCHVGKLLGGSAACTSDANCPTGQVCCAGACSDDCSSSEAAVVTVTLTTDYVPGYDFDAARVTLENDERVVAFTPVSLVLGGRAIAQFTGVAFSDHTLEAALTRNGIDVAAQSATLAIKGDTTHDVVLPRNGPQSCTSVSDCEQHGCTIAVCSKGVCLDQRNDASCADTERCVEDCVAQNRECEVDADCDDGASCTTETCVDGRCNVTPGACSVGSCEPDALAVDAATGCTTTLCTGRPAGFVCRASAGICDVAEVCDGVSDTCPDDGFRPTSLVCREATTACDVAELCDGVSAACPVDRVQPATTVCHPSLGACDPAESCDGTSTVCPVDAKSPNGTVITPISTCAYSGCNGGNTPVVIQQNQGAYCTETPCGYCKNGSCLDSCAESPNTYCSGDVCETF